MTEPERPGHVERSVRRLNATTLALVGGLVIVLLVVAWLVSRGNPNQDKLTSDELAQNQVQAKSPEKLCASNATYALIKRELFRRAAQLRGSDQGAFDQLSGYATLRMENPVMESQEQATGAVNCSGSLSLDLPPGVAVVGGRHTLTSDVDYTVQQAADGSGAVVLLRNADAIITPLATLARVGAPTATLTETPPPSTATAPEQPQQGEAPPAPEQEPAPQPSPPPSAAQSSSTHPSFDCAKARTKGEVAVCANSGLAALDRNMAAQYRDAINDASPEQKALLRRTRDRFLAYRDRCPNRSCIGEAYVGRMREIRDIMQGRWEPPR